MRLFLLIQLLVLGGYSQANYLTGKDVCDLNQDVRAKEIGISVEVPVDYAAADGQKTKIYAWTLKPFDPNKKSFIYFVGGPGGSAHSFRFKGLDNWNAIYIDQRGIACSRPATESIAKNPIFYSSEFVARDADLLRQQLGIKSWTVYGQSYGTVPATISASLFPETTEVLVIEGVIEKGDANLWNAPHRMKWLQKFYDQLPANLKNVVKLLSQGDGGEKNFSQVAFGMMYLDNPAQQLTTYLQSISEPAAQQKPAAIQATIKVAAQIAAPALAQVMDKITVQLANQFDVTPVPPDVLSEAKQLLYYSESNWNVITCKELSAMDPLSVFNYNFKDGKLSFDDSPVVYQAKIENCKALGVEQNGPLVKMYVAEEYPVKVPVTYLQGTTDGATQVNQAVHHYKAVPQGKAQLLLKKNGGHETNILPISNASGDTDEISPEGQIELQIFEQALLGLRVDQGLIEQHNAIAPAKWVRTDRGF